MISKNLNQKIYLSIKEVVKNAFDAIKEWLVSSVTNFAEFLGLKPDITFENEISW